MLWPLVLCSMFRQAVEQCLGTLTHIFLTTLCFHLEEDSFSYILCKKIQLYLKKKNYLMKGTALSLLHLPIRWIVTWALSYCWGCVCVVFAWGIFLVRGWRVVENKAHLLAKVVERETHNIEEVSMDILHKHSTKRLNTIATSLVPGTKTIHNFRSTTL